LEQKTIRLLPKLLSGRLDVAIVRPTDSPEKQLEFIPLFSETAVVAMPESHPLATRKIVTIDDLADQPLIVPDRRSRPHSHDLTIKLFLEAGQTARIAQVAEEKQTIVSLVSTGVGLAIVPKWASRLAVGGVNFVDLDGPTEVVKCSLALTAVCLKDTRHDARDAFLKILQENLMVLSKTA
jgi:DNA-binding transcriptional LysR family regulator